MDKVVRRRYLGGSAALLGGLLAAACGEIEVRYVQGPAGATGPAGQAGAAGKTGATGASGAKGEAGQSQVVQTEKIVKVEVEKPIIVEKVKTVVQEVEKQIVVEKRVEVAGKTPKAIGLTYLNKHLPGTVGDTWDKKMIKGFQAVMPNVAFISIPTTESRKTKFTVMAAAGTPATMVQNDWGVWVDLARGGAIMEMTNLFKTDKISPRDTFLRWSVEQYSHGDRMFGFPLSQSSDSFPYNKDIFDQYGVEHPPSDVNDKSWTMERFLEDMLTIKRGMGANGFPMQNTHGYHWNRGTWFGHSSWDDKTGRATINHPLWIQGQQWWMDATHKHKIIPTADERKEMQGGAKSLFHAGKAAMYYTCCPHNAMKDVRGQFNAALATLPFSGWDTKGNTMFPGQNISGRVWPHNMHVANEVTPDYKDAAWRFFKWLMEDPKNGGLMPPSNSHIVAPYKNLAYSDVAQNDFYELTGVDGKAPLLNALTEYPSFCGMLKFEEYSKFWNGIKEDWAKVEANEMSATDFAKRAQEVNDNAKLGAYML